MLLPIPFLLYANYTDFKEKKIKNHMTYTFFLLAGIYQLTVYGPGMLLSGIGAMFIAVFIFSILPIFGLSGGDLKLLLGISMFLGHQEILLFSFFLSIFLLGKSIYFAIREKGIKDFSIALKMEMYTLGKIKAGASQKQIAAPCFLMAYFSVIIIQYVS